MALARNPVTRSYVQQDVLSKGPEELVLVAFDLGIKGCRRNDRALVRDVLAELVSGLDFSQPVAGNLLVLYDYALREVRENRFAEAEKILSGLRDAWQQALRAQRAAAEAPAGGSSSEIAAAA